MDQLKAAMMSARPVYVDILLIKAAKVKDIKILLKKVDLPPSFTYYETLKGDEEGDVNAFILVWHILPDNTGLVCILVFVCLFICILFVCLYLWVLFF